MVFKFSDLVVSFSNFVVNIACGKNEIMGEPIPTTCQLVWILCIQGMLITDSDSPSKE